MNPSDALFQQARQLGLRLEARGDKLAVIPASRCPAGFAEELRAHKRELMAHLEACQAGLPPDARPWLYIARQVLAGEFDGGSRGLLNSIAIGLRGTPHPEAWQALAKLGKGLPPELPTIG